MGCFTTHWIIDPQKQACIQGVLSNVHGMNKAFGFTSKTENLWSLRTCILVETANLTAVNNWEYEKIKQQLRIKALEGPTYINS